MSWRQFLKSDMEVLRVKRVLSPPDDTHKTLKTLKTPRVENEIVPVAPLPEWQNNFCIAHAELNHWRGCCPCSIDDCLISKIIDAEGDIDKLRGLEIGHEITTDQVINKWIEAGEPVEDLLKSPTWLVCFADHLQKGKNNESQ